MFVVEDSHEVVWLGGVCIICEPIGPLYWDRLQEVDVPWIVSSLKVELGPHFVPGQKRLVFLLPDVLELVHATPHESCRTCSRKPKVHSNVGSGPP
jgi:hypothetical protein